MFGDVVLRVYLKGKIKEYATRAECKRTLAILLVLSASRRPTRRANGSLILQRVFVYIVTNDASYRRDDRIYEHAIGIMLSAMWISVDKRYQIRIANLMKSWCADELTNSSSGNCKHAERVVVSRRRRKKQRKKREKCNCSHRRSRVTGCRNTQEISAPRHVCHERIDSELMFETSREHEITE